MQDATVQSTPQTSQAPAVAPSSYVAAPSQAPTQQAPVNYQVGTSYPQAVPTVAPQGTTSYQSSPTQSSPQSPSEQNSPWETAFNRVVGLLGSPVQSPFQGQPSQAPAQTPVQYSPANYGQTQSQTTPVSAPQISSPSQDYSTNSSQTYSVSSLADVADLVGWSPESRMVIENYGTEAPAILNQYALNLEGVVDSAVAWGHEATDLLTKYADFAVNEHQENLTYNEMLTNPDILSDYTLEFFGPNGPYPVYENEGQLETPGYPTAPAQAQGYQNIPGMPAPPAAEAPEQPADFWGSFKEQMDRDPSQAWRLVNQASPQAMANKLFVME